MAVVRFACASQLAESALSSPPSFPGPGHGTSRSSYNNLFNKYKFNGVLPLYHSSQKNTISNMLLAELTGIEPVSPES